MLCTNVFIKQINIIILEVFMYETKISQFVYTIIASKIQSSSFAIIIKQRIIL